MNKFIKFAIAAIIVAIMLNNLKSYIDAFSEFYKAVGVSMSFYIGIGRMIFYAIVMLTAFVSMLSLCIDVTIGISDLIL